MEQKITKLLNRLTFPYVVTLFFIIAFIVYGNALFNGFVGDDNSYIIENPQTHQVNLPLSFGVNIFNGSGQYRPIPATYFSLLYALFGNASFFYHFFELLLHILCAILIYVFARKFLSPGITLLLTLIFLVHPIDEEVVAHITDLQDVLYMFFGLLSLLISTKKHCSRKDLMVIFSLLLLSLLTKETGILFIILLLTYSFLFARKNLVKLSVGAFLTFIVYLFFRFYIGHVGFSERPLIPIASLPLPGRLLNMPAIVFYYLKILIFPGSPAFDQQWVITFPGFSAFFLPLLVDGLFFAVFMLSGIFIHKFHRQTFRQYLFFSVWFLLGLFLLLQIFPLDMTVADRWFYFPMAGLLGMLGVLNQSLAHHTWMKHKIIPVLLAVVILCGLSFRTIQRNVDWRNTLTLYAHDMQISDNFDIENTLGIEYGNSKEYEKAVEHFEKSIALRPNEHNLSGLGLTYENMGDIQKAKNYYDAALHAKDYKLSFPAKHDINTCIGYASILVLYENSSSALPFIQNALSDYPYSSDLWFLLAVAKYRQYGWQGAMEAASKASQLNPQYFDAYNQMQNNKPVSIDLNGKMVAINPK